MEQSRVWVAIFLSLGLFYQPLMPEVAVWFQDFDSMLAGFAGDVERSGSRLLVLIFPERLQVNPEDWALTKRAYCLDASAFDLDYPNRRIKASSARLNVPVLDLTDAFRDHVHSGDGQLYRPRGDMHFSELGQRLAATMVGQYFLEH